VGQTEADFDGSDLHTHAPKGGVGHVVGLTEDPAWVTVYFERSGTGTDCATPDLIWLGGPLQAR